MSTDLPPGLVTNNRRYHEDYEYSIQIVRWFLKPVGAWPESTRVTFRDRVLSKILNIVCYSLVASTVLPCLMFILFEETDLHSKLKAIGPMSHWLMGGLNYCSLLAKAKRIRECVEQMKYDWRIVNNPSDRSVMHESAKFGRFVACLAVTGMQIGISVYCIVSGTSKARLTVGNETVLVGQMPCPFYNRLLEARYVPSENFIFATQLLSGFVVTSITTGACGLAAVLAMHACGQLNLVMSWLDELVDRKRRKPVEDRLADIVKHHLRVLNFISHIEEVMHQICLVELVGCTFNLCMLGYYSITEWYNEDRGNALVYVAVFFSMSFNIFIFCYISENISEQCRAVGERAYMTEWYRLPSKTALDLILVISRSSVMIRITAGKLIRLSIATFGDVIRTSAAYLNILRTMTM